MMHSVLRRILMKMTQMPSVTAVNTLTRKQQRFILELGIITQVQVGLFQGIVMLVKMKSRFL